MNFTCINLYELYNVYNFVHEFKFPSNWTLIMWNKKMCMGCEPMLKIKNIVKFMYFEASFSIYVQNQYQYKVRVLLFLAPI